MRFDLIDRVVERTADRLVALKNVTSAEEYLQDHFPSFPVLPGVMMLETLVQAARVLLADDSRLVNDEPLVLAQVRNVRYGNMVRPGQCLEVEVTLRDKDDRGWEMMGVGKVDGQVAVQGRFRMEMLTNVTAATSVE